MEALEADLCIVGGGPAGMVAGLLFARAGVRTIVLEKHGDFLRDFRGDTVHPSTLRLFHEMGLLEKLLRRPHDKVHGLGGFIGDRYLKIADFSGFNPRWNFIAMMPQWDFLDFVADEARLYPNFRLIMHAEATGLIAEGGRVTGVRYEESGAEREIRARLVIAADGRRSVLREEAGFKIRSMGAPMDVFWFRLPKARTPDNRSTGVFVAGRIMALIDRGDYWQCAYVFGKGQEAAVKASGLDAFRADVARAAPMVADAVGAIQSWGDVKLLSVALDRLETWHKPGLLVIGDAAHAMSPIGGVGINVAVQDAVAAANILAGPMARGEDVDPLLGRVEKRRRLQVRTIQAFQDAAQKRIIQPLLADRGGAFEPPRVLRWLDRWPLLRRIPAAFLGFGIRPEHVRSPS
ncbi:FAD-dependent oxidoreductase [Allosphingosinicella flava]|uniref:FAD-dependent oxidoreductase n=1 Tax=Allosphingosinicella flava TaxID=2771430 RepID=A0A7T2GKW3_9SPHN|nr:FAD-dependent oxidoreductase [Sphingosinicella flava]QPQ55729.1 FAD-dependent oxidoreductase [Sphingosinicella flava]